MIKFFLFILNLKDSNCFKIFNCSSSALASRKFEKLHCAANIWNYHYSCNTQQMILILTHSDYDEPLIFIKIT